MKVRSTFHRLCARQTVDKTPPDQQLQPIDERRSAESARKRRKRRRRRRRHQRGTVENWLEEEGWYAVQLEGEAANLKPENCRADVLAL